MPERDFNALERRLLARGIAPRHAARMAEELAGHFEDLRLAAEAEGWEPEEASRVAGERLGQEDAIAEAAAARRELRTWSYRHPRVARAVLPLIYVALLPAAPAVAGMAHSDSIVRWSASLSLSAAFTALLLLIMQLSINLS